MNLTDFNKTTIMKLRLVLVVLLFLPLLVKGQSDVIFYSKGKMHVKYKPAAPSVVQGESSSTTLYIDGSVKFVTGASIVQKGRTEITKDFINAKDPSKRNDTGESPQLFVKKDETIQDDGVIAFIGKPVWNATLGRNVATLQRIYGNNLDVATATWDRSLQKKFNWINFPTISVEKGQPVTITESGKVKYTDDWRKLGYLVVDTSAAISVDYIRADEHNRFAVNASYDKDDVDRINSGHARINNVHAKTLGNPLALARYSQVNLEMYKFTADGSAATDDGYFQSEKITDAATFGKTLRTATGHPQGGGWNYLTGFTPPFEQLGADYMFYHTLTKPNGSSITSYEGPIVDPFFRMKAGRGYFISMEVSHADHTTGEGNINGRWDFFGGNKGIFNERRARGGYVFNRSVFQDYLSVPEDQLLAGEQRMDNFSRFLYDNTTVANIFNSTTKLPLSTTYNVYGEANRPLKGLNLPQWMEISNGVNKDRSRYELMDQEKFNVGSITVELEAGLNFLGNPFMAPISLNPLLGFETTPNSSNSYNELAEATNIGTGFESTLFTPVGATSKVKISSVSASADVRAKYWLINQALVKYYPTENIFRYRTTYDFVSRVGASAISAIQDGRTSAPGTGIPGDGDSGNALKWNPLTHVISPMQMFCIQASKSITIKIDSALQVFGLPRFAKNAVATKAISDGNSAIMKDWFIVEAKSRDGLNSDRATVIFNDDAKPQYKEDSYDTRKGVSEAFETYEDIINGKPTKTSFEQSKAVVYTKSSDQENLLGNAVPTQTKELALYFMSPSSTQEMTLRFYGLDNLESVPGVWLIDRYLDNKAIKITPETEYTFVSEAASNSKSEVNDNRFILRFYDTGGTVVENEKGAISCYYNSSTLYISGLIEDDVNSDIIIYDMQGRLMARTKITELQQPWSYVKPLNIGTYIVKIVGKRNHTVKFVNLQN